VRCPAVSVGAVVILAAPATTVATTSSARGPKRSSQATRVRVWLRLLPIAPPSAVPSGYDDCQPKEMGTITLAAGASEPP
jgi:hypothetical protein